MSVGVLGPLLTDDGPLSPRERSVLSALVLRSGLPVSRDELADAVWSDAPPGTWPKQVQHAVSLLRRSLGSRLITTGPGGYTLVLDPDSVDAHRFDRLVGAARVHADDGDPARALDSLDRALRLWRGAPYQDLPAWPPAIVEAARLTEVRVEAEELQLRARLALGEHASVIAGAERLVREHPLREPRWALLATALYRSGRQADALAAIRAARECLAEELGIEPGEELRRLELGILRHDAELDVGEPPATPSDLCPYHGLTAFGADDEDDFFGRGEDVDVALDRLARSPFLAVTGASGSGKSSLVRAGLVPVLRRRGDHVVILSPSCGLAAAIRDAV
jgi:DNA-binding SARP family transcriptional activator